MKYRVEIHPIIALLLILLASVGVYACWTRQAKPKRTGQPPLRSTASTRMPPPSSSDRPPRRVINETPITPTGVTVERDATKPTGLFGRRHTLPSIRPDVDDIVAERLATMNAQVKAAAMNGANAYVEQHQ